MSKDFNSSDSWYSPLAPAVPEEKPKKKSRRGWRIAGVIFIIAALIVGSSLAFAKPKDGPAIDDGDWSVTIPGQIPGGQENELPDDWHDFFDSYYTETQSQDTQIDIPKVKLESKFSLSLKKTGTEELSLKEIYASCSDSIVAVTGYYDGVSGYSWGTGVIMSEDGLILTNTHVIEGCNKAMVILADDTSYEAELVGADSISDIAVLKIDASGLPAAEFGDSSGLAVGDKVAAIGNPLGETFRMTLTDGIISAIERGISYNGHSMTLLQTNTALNEGNSGGALFNMYGQVIGITNMKMMSSYSSIEGIGFAIPSSTVASVVSSITEYGEVRGRPSIGITVGAIPDNASDEYELPSGLYVSKVSEGSDAQKKGVEVGDIVIAVNGSFITTTEEVQAIKDTLKVGDSMSLTIWREGDTFNVDVVLVDTNDIY